MQLLERGPVQLDLSRLLHSAASGQGQLVFLGGEAGIGKSSLVLRFSEISRGRARLLMGACDPLSTPRPLGPLLDMQPQLGRRLREQLSSQADKYALFRGFLAELASSTEPVVAVFEDVHWADEATLDLLRFLGRRLEGVPALLIATYRSDEVGDRHPLRVVLGDMATLPAVQRLALDPLSLDAVRTLCVGTGLDAARLHAQTGGNPFYVTQVIAVGGAGIPATVRDAVLARAARLPPGARAALDVAAVLGFRFEPNLLEAVAQPSSEAVDALMASGMMRAEGERLVFHHELAREAVLEVLPAHRRLDLHRRVLDVLRGLTEGRVDIGQLAHHAEGAGDAEAVLEYAPRAAERAQALSAHREAVSQLARALNYADRLDASQQGQLWEAYSWECVATDQWAEATRAGRERLAIWQAAGDRLREGQALSFLVGCLATTGDMAEAKAASQASLARLESLPPGPELAEILGMDAYLQTLMHNTAEAMASARRVLSLAGPGGGSRAGIMGHTVLGAAEILAGDPDREERLQRALELAREVGNSWDTAAVYFNYGTAWAVTYEFARAEHWLQEGLAHAVAHELDGWETNLRCWLALVHLYLGRWPEAEESATRVVGHARACTTSRIVSLQVLGRLKVRRGDGDAPGVLVEGVALALPTGTLRYLGPVQMACAEASWLAGDLDGVQRNSLPALDLARDKCDPWTAGEALFWLYRARAGVDVPEWIARPFALQIAGDWAEAAAEWRTRGCPYEAAQALAETGEPENIRAALQEFERLGAVPAAQRAKRRLREVGVRRIPRGPRASTLSNPAGLTRREMEVVRLLAGGLQDSEIARRLFVSPKTVGHHVSAVLAKLGVHSRTEAAREAVGLGLLQDREPDVAK